ncbi:hypothetical protein CDAR_470611 [Caerostris darwini]|uniref:Uncharacterized protein n=1 Tax=Caerostris darwini TaxID=1538125 RepID=A0AAV4VGZ1_9ARAC|nr:hypothetical protein CDAR_470611 [Caerostris darwini]
MRSENSEDRQAGLETIGERRSEETEHHFQLGLEGNDSCQTRQRMTSEQRERQRQYMREWRQRVKSTETPEEREKRLQRKRVVNKRAREMETPEQRERRLERKRVVNKRYRETETPEQRQRRIERDRFLKSQARQRETPEQQPAFVIKEEPIEFDPEPSTSAEFIIQNANDDAFHVEPALVIREQPIQFDPQPSASADIVLKDEFVVSSEDYTGSSAVVPPSTEPTSHVTLSVARLGSSQQPDNDQ